MKYSPVFEELIIFFRLAHSTTFSNMFTRSQCTSFLSACSLQSHNDLLLVLLARLLGTTLKV